MERVKATVESTAARAWGGHTLPVPPGRVQQHTEGRISRCSRASLGQQAAPGNPGQLRPQRLRGRRVRPNFTMQTLKWARHMGNMQGSVKCRFRRGSVNLTTTACARHRNRHAATHTITPSHCQTNQARFQGAGQALGSAREGAGHHHQCPLPHDNEQ